MIILNLEYSLMVNLTLYIFFFKEKERLSALEKRYQSLTGGKTFSKPSGTKEVTLAMTVLIIGQLTCFWLANKLFLTPSNLVNILWRPCDLKNNYNSWDICAVSQYLVHWFEITVSLCTSWWWWCLWGSITLLLNSNEHVFSGLSPSAISFTSMPLWSAIKYVEAIWRSLIRQIMS